MVGHDQVLRVTSDIQVLEEKWKESQLGPHDSLSIFLNCIGKVIDIDESDDSVKLEWADFTNNWLPIKACWLTWSKELTIPNYAQDKDNVPEFMDQDISLLESMFGGV